MPAAKKSPPRPLKPPKASVPASASAATKSGEKTGAILAALNAIPHGHVTSYGEVAKRAGLPGYARFVCRVLKDLPDRSRTPWWRVIRSDGKFGMDEHCASGREQRKRLKEEGLEMKGDRVVGPWW